MKILSVSDYVEPALYNTFDSKRFQGIDLILSCGDLPPEYLSFLADMFNVPLYFVRGNHDIRFDLKSPYGCTDLHAKLIQIEGIIILGLEGSRWYNGGPHQYRERQMRKNIRRLRTKIWRLGGIDVVMTHAPPRHIHDAEDPCHRGFNCFKDLIDRYSPRYFIHGHIHVNFTDPSQRITNVNKTKVINSYGYYVFEINP
ncbi:MAG TPA: metallophosphoesterase [Desulfobacteraceae bacterium]|nr:metallophosphoesterase [Desulfobacteraceae bacterium]